MARTQDPADNDEDEDKAKQQSALVQLRRQRFAEKNKDCKLADMDAPIFRTDSYKKREWEKSSGDYIERCLAVRISVMGTLRICSSFCLASTAQSIC